jgi:dipeptidyl aminopeptidase/acylaminoacyl peptidase
MPRLAVALLALCHLGSGATFSLEQVLSAPFPSELTAAPGGGAVAWVLNERGARNVWYAAAPDFKGVRLTAYTKDDGQDIGQPAIAPNGRQVVYVRGGDFDNPGTADPNPASDPAGVEQAVWIVAPGQPPRRIAAGNSPAISPKGDRVAFLRAGQVWTAALDAALVNGSAQLIHTRAGVTAEDLTWSPDGSKLAFVSNRGNHALIAVYDWAAQSISYMDPSVDSDSSPVWSPDGSRIAFIRELQGGEPWSIRVAKVADGSGHRIWSADKGPGSAFHRVEALKQLCWCAGDRIVFPWEKDGWAHLYSVAAEGGAVAALTPGDFEVDHVAFPAGGAEILFSSNQGDIDRRHLWRVGANAGPPRPVTSGEGLEWRPVAAGGGVAFLHSDAKRPARAAILIGGAERDLAPAAVPSDFPAESLVVPRQVIYSSSDGMTIHGQLFLPADPRPGEKRPALVFMHGGPRRQMLLGWHYMDYYNNAYGMNQYLANHGYVVLSINYRSGIGYGHDFREAKNYGAAGASEFHDVEGAGLYLRGRPEVDGARIGLWGGSYGGYLTALGLARASDLFKAGVDFHGVHDWNIERPSRPPLAGTAAAAAIREDAAHVAFEASPLAAIRTWRSPVLLIHGDDDRNVAFSQTMDLVAALRAQGTDFEQLILPDEIHGFLRFESWIKAYAAEVDFFKRSL